MRSFVRTLGLFSTVGAITALTLVSPRLRNRPIWDGLVPKVSASTTKSSYDLTQLRVVNDVLRMVSERYVDPKRVKAREMFLSSLNFIQRDVPQIIVLHEEGSGTVRVRIDTKEKAFRADTVVGPWDVSARLREVFVFLQEELKNTEIDLRQIEYSACNGMLNTLDPHSVLLNPEAFKDMNVSTSGQFGGLGIEIGLRDQILTVIRPMPGTPAWRAGLKKYDRILKIDGESTLNMGTTEAVNHLRGVPGSKVTVYVHRDGPEGWQGVKPFELTREVIKLKSVEQQRLDGNIGYVRIKSFQRTTSQELDQALIELKKNNGLVMDLRGNHGGLLDEAVKVVDKFVKAGPIVATVGASEGRDEKVAKEGGTEPNYPLVVLVNSNSASASEIVAGALKNHERALIVGETTFGKGSVQIIFDNLPEKTGLKLTIAQYLTEPGDVSIQGTGITPDIELDPMTVDDKELDLMADSNGVRERDLNRSLSNTRAREGQKPLETVRYNLTMKERQDWRDRGWDPDDTFVIDFPIKFARELVSKSQPGTSPEQLRAAKNFINEVRNQEITNVVNEFKTFGVDWSMPVEPPAAVAEKDVEIKVETDRPDGIVRAGEPISLKVSVTNKGASPIYRLRATTKSDSGYFENKELAFGKIDPGKTKTAVAPLGFCEPEGYKPGSTAVLPKDAPRVCKIPRDALARTDGIVLQFEDGSAKFSAKKDTRITVSPLERPMFAYGYQIVDNRKGNGDGLVQRDEGMTMYLVVKNVGKGRSYETQANLRNLSGDGILLHTGRFDLSNMEPGDIRKVAFTFDVQGKLQDNEAKVELSVTDRDLREVVAEKIKLPVVAPMSFKPAGGLAKAKRAGVEVLESPGANARVIGLLGPELGLAIKGKSDSILKVQLDEDRYAFVRTVDVSETSGAPAKVEPRFSHAPPMIDVAAVPLATRDSKITIRGSVSDSEKILDSFIFVGTKKLFYRSNRSGTDPKKMSFETELPLRPGINLITIVARETPETTSRRTLVIRRDGPNGELLETPKNEEDLAENFASAED